MENLYFQAVNDGTDNYHGFESSSGRYWLVSSGITGRSPVFYRRRRGLNVDFRLIFAGTGQFPDRTCFLYLGLHSGIEWTSTGVVWAPLLFLGSGMFWVLRSGLGKMQVPVLVYILVILIMSGLAWERHLQLELPQTLFAACGAILFLISDAMLAWNRFRMRFKSAQFFILSTYYVAQSAIAISMSQVTSRVLS